ncbi:MAG: AraC family transcriptional regulator [Alphaproteobacteria bacterium]|nr:MAG: AraC family transcriptional regulator [Alphaproteobacteria bacterium]
MTTETKSRSQDLTNRIARTIAFIGDNLDRDLRLDTLAAVACFSPHHFQRLYLALVGETPAETHRRLRLHRAASALVLGPLAITTIAQQAGYGSTAAFGRAFAAMFGVPPATYRRRGHLVLPPSSHPLAGDQPMYQVDIVTAPALTLAALEHRGPYGEIPPTFQRVFLMAGAAGLMTKDTLSIGIYYDDPASVPADQLRSHAGIILEDGVACPPTLTPVTLPATRAARLVFQGPYAELQKPYAWLYGTWLQTSGEEPADVPSYEIYLNDCQALPPAEWLTAIYLPLR